MSVKTLTIAIYARLSKEDGEVLESDCKTHSNSIQNQLGLIRNYIQKHEDLQWYSVVEFCDDGYSGTNFNRPGIMELLKCVNEKKIHCIVVKDFSRFGRNYLEVGNYIEKVFPVLGVRFISINDNYDNKMIPCNCGMEAAVKNLLYDYYSKDLSQKVKASFKVKKETGYHLGGGVPYGYLRSHMNRGQIIIDEEAAVIVQRIFQMTMEGYTRAQIARILNEEDIPSPAEHIMRLSKDQMVWAQPRKKYYWTLDTIIRILRNQVYIGNTINSKYQVKEIGSSQTILLPKKNWNIVLSTHEAIITNDLFEAVQKTFKNKIKKVDKEKNCKESYRKEALNQNLSGIIKGKLKCGYCNYNMDLVKAKNPYYQCISHRFLPQAVCSREHADAIKTEYFIALILIKFEKLISQITCSKDNSIKYNQNSTVIKKTETRLRKELKQIKLKEMKNYEKFKNNLLSNEEFRKRIAEFQLRKIEIHQILGQTNCQETSPEKDEDSAEKIKKLANKWLKTIYFYDANHIEFIFLLQDGLIPKAGEYFL